VIYGKICFSVSPDTRTTLHAQIGVSLLIVTLDSRHADGSVELEWQSRCQTLYDLDGLSGGRALVAVLRTRPDQQVQCLAAGGRLDLSGGREYHVQPIVVDNVMYVQGTGNAIVALDAANG
jgi:hypothetical protein